MSDRNQGRGPGTTRLRVAGISLVLALAAAELALRAAHRWAPGSVALERLLYMPGSRTRFGQVESLPELLALTGHGFRPYGRSGDFALSSRSLKTEEYRREKAPGVTRIVLLGDSFTFSSGGVPYEDLWHVRLERELERRLGRPVEVISLGVPSVGADFELRMWQVEGRLLAADLVLLGFYVGNDFLDVAGELADRTPMDALARRSFVARLVRNGLRLQGLRAERRRLERVERTRRELGKTGGHVLADLDYDYAAEVERMPEASFLSAGVRRSVIYDPERREELEAAFERVAALLTQLRDEVRASGSRLALSLFPDELQVDAAFLERVAAELGRESSELDVEAPQRRMTELLASLDVPCLDLLPAFRGAGGGGKPLYAPRNTHWNVAGNALAAARILEFLLGEGLLR